MAKSTFSGFNGKSKEPDTIDIELGRRIRTKRLQLGLSQTDLANACGVTFQQIQKYESGTNRISASRLLSVATALNLHAGVFYDGFQHPEKNGSLFGVNPSENEIKLVRAFADIADSSTQRAILRIVEEVGVQNVV